MTELKLAKLPDRTPIKMTITVMPDTHAALCEYAALYARAYGQEAPVADLVSAMLETFLDSDRGFQKARRDGLPPSAVP